MSSENYTIAGFGSLFLPPSIMRVDESVEDAKQIYDKERRYGDEGLLRKSAVEVWAHEERKMRENAEDAKNIVPVKIDGFQRRYSLDVDYGGAMLDVERDEESRMNAVIITGLSEGEKEKLDSSEDAYETEELEIEDVEPYLDKHKADLEEAFEDRNVQIYVGEPKTTERLRNQTYQGRIHTGMDFIGEMYGEKLAKEMWEEFKETTEERWRLSSEISEKTEEEIDEMTWSKVNRNDQIQSIAEMHGYKM